MRNQPQHKERLDRDTSTASEIQIGVENPFPGLRPFSIEDSHLFFGREGQIDEILSKLAKNRFVTVMGYSGSGKSSLMSCGLVPVLYGGFVAESGTEWRAITARPGSSPINSLIESVIEYLQKVQRIEPADVPIHKAIVSSVLRSGPGGLVELASHLQRDSSENIFFLIDQFEEIFRYRDHADAEAQNDAQLYVNLFMTAVQQTEVPVYVALTMRSDFIGECSIFPGLTRLINSSNYLVPQMTREQKKVAIEGPIAVAGGKIAPRLVKRLLSDMGIDQDQLPILQHALMRTWDYWLQNHESGEPIDVRHYTAIGKISEALSQHANEAFDELSSRNKLIAEVLFKSITEKNQQNRGMRRPCQLSLIAQLAEGSEEEVIYVVEQFRKPGRSFLMPAANIPLNGDSIIELSHESLIRIWNRLAAWVDDEFESATMYKRLSDAAAMYQIGKTGLWRTPDLQLALNWQKKQKPTREWAQRYDEAFERAIVFLDTSRITYEAELKNQEMMQRRVLRRTRTTAIILGIAFLIAILFFVYAYLQKLQADADREYADIQKTEAQTQREEALRQKKEADNLRVLAERTANELVVTNNALGDALEATQRERDRAENALMQAQVSEKKAMAATEEANRSLDFANLKKEEADLNYEFARNQLMLRVAQVLATKSVQEDDDKDLAALQALQGHIFHRRYSGKKYDPYIYRGLYSALTKIIGASYNAMKVQGPPRIHMRSLVVSDKSSNFFVSGADGRVYKGDYEKLSNAATGFATPYPSKVIALSKDENYIINGSDSSFVQVYNLQGKAKPKVIKGLGGATNDIEFLPNNSGFIVASSNKTLSLVNHETGEVKTLATFPYEIKSISISSDGKFLVGGSWSGQVIKMNLQDYTYTTLATENSSRILSVKFSPSGNYLAYGVDVLSNKRGLVKLYDFTTGETRQFSGHRAGVYDVEFSPDEKLLASAGLDKRLQLYVLDNPEDLPVEMENNNGFVWDIAFAKGSNLLVAACSESEIRVWPTDPAILAIQICPNITRKSMTQDEWTKYVGNDIEYENTCTGF
ncbi:nSTAND1 domain-containing NTPase [Ohtaekwangia sp.]|uniref:nSTAND1 domain-containing NTPase n=1 Tax=Ohtaekwangia sp. TaxID=2066019 RepID=UPI002F923760